MEVRRFELPVAVTLRLQSRSGAVEVIAEPREDVEVEGHDVESLLDAGGSTLRIRAGRGHKKMLVRCPRGTDVVVGTMSGGVRLAGDFGRVSVTTMSGSIEVDEAEEVDARCGPGEIRIGRCAGHCRLSTASGSIEAREVGSCAVQTLSGGVRIGMVNGKLRARTVSGRIEATTRGGGPVQVQSVSGRVRIGLPAGVAVSPRFKTISGKVRSAFPKGDDIVVEGMTVSGSIELVPS
ncbi:MAG TPA: DUF4097 family beta strand repeat-containing protein [Dehalococcoidia bacterium]|nr:DUF4097 family beta strand repeat-containing protein [Dehalococcoidia bacterium]